MQRTFTYFLIFSTVSLILTTTFCQAQDNQRYIALSLVNVDYRNSQIDQINKAADIGMNAVIITVRWDVIYQFKANSANPWEQYDLQIQTARSRGMKVCLRLCMYTWCNTKVIGNPEDNTVPSCDGLPNADRMVGYDVSGKNNAFNSKPRAIMAVI